MLESYFKLDHTLRRLRAEPTGRYMDDFAKTLHTKGYGVCAAQAYLRAAAHLGIWMKQQGLSVMKLDDQVIGEFARHLPSCRCLGKNRDRKSTRLNSSHGYISYAVFCLKKKKIPTPHALDLSTH